VRLIRIPFVSSTSRFWFFVVVAAAGLAISGHFYRQYQSSDAAQVTRFHGRRTDYQTLLEMLRDDKQLTFINEGVTQPEDPTAIGIAPQRIAEYRRLMSKIDCGAILFDPGGRTLFVSGRYDLNDPDILFAGKGSHASSEFRYLEDGWYWAFSH
jgi:hypothetical protein